MQGVTSFLAVTSTLTVTGSAGHEEQHAPAARLSVPAAAGSTISKGYVAPKQKQGIDDQRFVAINGLICHQRAQPLLGWQVQQSPCMHTRQGCRQACSSPLTTTGLPAQALQRVSRWSSYSNVFAPSVHKYNVFWSRCAAEGSRRGVLAPSLTPSWSSFESSPTLPSWTPIGQCPPGYLQVSAL